MRLPSLQLRLNDICQLGGQAKAVEEWVCGGLGGENTHWSNESSYHCKEEGEDGHQHAGLAEPPEDSAEGRSFPAVLLQLIVPQLLQPANTVVTSGYETGPQSKSQRIKYQLRTIGCEFENGWWVNAEN